jgi:ParB family chromosome partitioning protein
MTTPTTTTPEEQHMSTPTIDTAHVGTLQHVAPGTLLLKRNIRDAKPSPELVESLKIFGVLEPVTAVTSRDGLVVRYGHRRVLAAVEAGLDAIPVYVRGADELDDDAEISRVISQFDENTVRDGLTTADEVGVVEQLVAFGLSAEEISKQARLDPEGVAQAVTVSKSKLASKATTKYEALTLEQAAAIAEFEDDVELAKSLIVTAIERPGQFEHTVQRVRDDRARAAAIHEATEQLEAKGIKVIEAPGYDDTKTRQLSYLVDAAGKDITTRAHVKCPGHVAWFPRHWNADPVYGCLNYATHGHKYRYGSSADTAAADLTPAEREKAKKARRLVIDNNKAWDSAQTVRRAWLADLAKRKTAPKGAAAHIAAVLGHDAAVLTDYRVGKLANEWLGISQESNSAVAECAAKASEGRALLIVLVQVLAAIESMRSRDDWRQNGKTSTAGRHLSYLESIGYELSDVEKYAVSTKTGN